MSRSKRSEIDRLVARTAGMVVRHPDTPEGTVLKDELRVRFDSYIAPGTNGNTYGIIVATGVPLPLPTGTPPIEEVPLYIADIDGVTSSFESGRWIRAIYSEAIDLIDLDGAGGNDPVQVNWELNYEDGGSTVRAVVVDPNTGLQSPGDPVDPLTVDGNETRYYSGTLAQAGDIWILANDHHRLRRNYLEAEATYLGLLTGTYDPNAVDAVNFPTPDERPVYRIDPESDGETIAIVTTAADAGDWSTAATPAPSVNGRCTTYKIDQTGAQVVDQTNVEFKNHSPDPLFVNDIITIEEFQGERIGKKLAGAEGLIAKITSTIAARTNDNYPSVVCAIGHLVNGTWTQLLASETVYSPSRNSINPDIGDIQIPVIRSNGQWVLAGALDLYQAPGYVSGNDQSIGRDANSDWVGFQDDGAC